MIVDEESKGQPAAGNKDLEIGGYEDDSEDELEIREQEENEKDFMITLNEEGIKYVGQIGDNPATLVVCEGTHSQSLAKIMLASDWQEIGKATSKKTSTKDSASAADKEPKTILQLFAMNGAAPVYFALPDVDKMSGAAINPIVSQLFG